jgi:pilus assembly protein CpaF
VHLERLRDGSRKVVQISEVSGMEEDVITMQDVFKFIRSGVDNEGRVIGRFSPTGIRPRILERLEELGLETPPEIELLFPDFVHSAQSTI